MRNQVPLSEVEDYVSNVYHFCDNRSLIYHNLHHTRYVVDKVHEIAPHYPLEPAEQWILTVAAWFHDIGHLFTDIARHEAKSVSVMRSFLDGKAVEERWIAQIGDCILATRMPTRPQTILQEILCDADTYNLGTDDFMQTNDLVLKELETRTRRQFPNWPKDTLAFLSAHHFYTTYCRVRLNKKKAENIAFMQAVVQQQG